MNSKLATILSVAVFALTYYLEDKIADAAAIPTFIDEWYIDTDGYPEKGYTTDAGTCFFFIAVMIAYRSYRAFVTGRVRGDFTARQEITWLTWLSGLILYVILSNVVWNLDIKMGIRSLMATALAIGLGFFGYKIHGMLARSYLSRGADDARSHKIGNE